MKGLGAVFVVLVMALAGIGAGYAVTFQDKVTIHYIAKSTHLKVGIAAIGTNDDSEDSDSVSNYYKNHDPYYSGDGVGPSRYDVAYTNVWNQVWKFNIEGSGFYEKMHVRAEKIYPNYAPTVKFLVGVEGNSVPAQISGFVFEFKEKNLTSDEIVAEGKITGVDENGNFIYKWVDGEPSENTIIYNPETGEPNFDVVSYTIWGSHIQKITGDSLQGIMDGFSVTIPPGEVIHVSVTMRYTDVPQDHYLEGNWTLNYIPSLEN